jgi:beta-lactamase regulating signal transducer with metallopeptidase domain
MGVGTLFLVALALRPLAPRDAVLRYRLMVAALFTATLLLPIQALTAELAPRPSFSRSASVPPPPASAPAAESPLADVAPPAPARRPVTPFSSLVVSPGTPDGGAGLESTLLALYLAGTLAVVGFHAVRAAAVRSLLRRARPVTDPRLLRLWKAIVADLRRPPQLLECDMLHAPACRALGRPAVIVPTASGALDDDTLRAVLQHELVHLRRRDGAIAFLAAAMTALLWFQPLTWVFARVLRTDREHSCDAIVVRATQRPRAYALALLRFCDPAASARRATPLIGFESARSIRRRITMLAHAPQPAARPRHILAFGVGLACLASASAAHALLTAVAGPGPALGADAPATVASGPRVSGDKDQSNPRMTAEIRAAADGRSDAQVVGRLLKQGAIAPGDLLPRDPWWAFPSPADKQPAAPTPITWITDQETVLSAHDVQVEGDTLKARRVSLSLPEGSKLRAVFEGRSVNFEPGAEGNNRVLVTGGTVRIVDESGVTRIQISADSARDDVTLVLTSTVEAGEINFELAAADGTLPVSLRLDTRTGVPEGERQPPHGAIRWNLRTPQNGPGTCELKMQWIYDLSQLPRTDGC